jgi:hypothetical protein
MTKAQRADALLWAAKWWQNEDCCSCHGKISEPIDELLRMVETQVGLYGWLIWASKALSEVGALGFNLEDVEAWDRESKTWRKL